MLTTRQMGLKQPYQKPCSNKTGETHGTWPIRDDYSNPQKNVKIKKNLDKIANTSSNSCSETCSSASVLRFPKAIPQKIRPVLKKNIPQKP